MEVLFPNNSPNTAVYLTGKHISSRGKEAYMDDALVSEHTLKIYIDGIAAYQLVCSPNDVEDLVLGRLLSEGVISSLHQVEKLIFSEDFSTATVYTTKASAPVDEVPLVDSCGNSSKTVCDTLDELSPIPIQQEWIFKLAQGLKQNNHLYEATHGTHSCLLMIEGEILHMAEDIGRHNALDKCLGWALRNQIPLSKTILYTSGRIPMDMVRKVIRAGVPIFASKAMPTAQAVELAKSHRLTLIGAARADSLVIF